MTDLSTKEWIREMDNSIYLNISTDLVVGRQKGFHIYTSIGIQPLFTPIFFYLLFLSRQHARA
jgi:hypothetical protein